MEVLSHKKPTSVMNATLELNKDSKLTVFDYRNLVFVLSIIMASGVYYFDTHTPLGIADGMLYVLIVAKGFFIKDDVKLIALTGYSVLLIWIGYFESPISIGVESFIPLTNRVLATITILVTAFFVGFSVQKEQKLQEQLNETKRTNEELEKSKTQLIQVNDELEAFSYSVSHDLRAPLRAIMGFSQELNTKLSRSLDEESFHFLDRIIKNADKMGALIDDLLKYSRTSRKTVSFSRIDINRLVDGVLENYFPKAAQYVKKEKLEVIHGDADLLEHVFMNLIGNAIKYSGKVASPRIIIASQKDEESTTISISDNGVGFDMNYSDKLFRIFERLHSDTQFEGSGVGLPICKKIMNKHQGEIWGESFGKGKGAKFYLKFKREV